MKISTTTDFTKFPRAGSVLAAAEASGPAFASVELAHDERRLRRKALPLADGSRILVDFLEPVTLHAGDRLVLDDGRQVEVRAAPEELLEIIPRDAVHLAELAWHIGNRHLAAAIEPARILILHDHVIDGMLQGLGAEVRHVVAPFEPLRGAYGGHGHHDHGHGHHDHDQHDHGERDAHGRAPGDPHYGHNHG
ncbi:MAG: urease accessory protein UreE [Rhizobiaceae bacterium]|nr:urease accessory protein UreE [Rhizobiaceae bacterium]